MAIKKRDSNIELFRIFLMLMIISHHYVVNSGITDLFRYDEISANTIFLELWGWGGKCGINCFILITGYFMCKQSFSWFKFLKLVLEVEFYSIGIYLILSLGGVTNFNFIELSKSVLILPRDIGHGFTGSFIALYLLIPYINMCINQMTKKQHSVLLIILLIIFTLIPTFLVTHVYEYLGWYVTVYLIGSWIRLYPQEWMTNQKKVVVILVINYLLVVASILAMFYFGLQKHQIIQWDIYYFVSDSNKVFAVTMSVLLFCFFKNINIGYNKSINKIAATVFGVFLIHTSGDAMRHFLWNDLLKTPEHYYSDTLFLHAIFSVLIIFAIGSLIDRIRTIFIEKPLFRIFNDIYINVYKQNQ
ncbi:acyltransferase family protein [Hoylesella timonensis]|uniref:Beta-carotene 15,15'-monooxygenase n=1 Tax=Hoylesella timonensis TaxID=386414 RepID=A0A2N6Q5S4_9BACT|nr:acyltransferase family protein [Hoylesella timonensis]PMC10328.1 beta-carotene 15,15'-monooxygenase [Hoylesella timonensis]